MTQRAEVASPGRSYNHPCLIAQALDVLGDRWTLIILRDLMTGLEHFNDILDNCDGLSPNVLSSRLKRLEAEGLVERHYHRDLPPRVTYNLTEKGWAVRPVLVSLIQWSGTYGRSITPESVGTDVSADFVARVIPAFAFDPECAAGVTASLRIELTDCEECRDWTLVIGGGRIIPQRNYPAKPT
ncbi:MAG: helix-turn-helix domain-containing protein [Dehalococcoidia bacterium]|nr:helix-turn-helix domain-containing protein [Dehalococcoidia bacterium]